MILQIPSFLKKFIHLKSFTFNRENIFKFLCLTFFFINLYFVIEIYLYPRYIVDESVHFNQIVRFIDGNFIISNRLTTLPFFHLFSALTGKLFLDIKSILFFRLLNTVVSIGLIYTFHKILREHNYSREISFLRTAQFAFLPIFFPFYFIIYTDPLSNLLILLSYLFLVKKQYFWSGIFSFLSVATRQTNVFWMALILFWGILQEYRSNNFNNQENSKISLYFVLLIKKFWVFLINFLTFIAFVVENKGVAIGDKEMHPAFQIYFGNIYFSIFLLFFLFLPIHVENRHIIYNLFKNNWRWITLTILAAFPLFLLNFKIDHPYNNIGTGFLRNYLLHYLNLNFFTKTFLFAVNFISILSLISTPLLSKKYYLIYPIFFLTIIFSWLIEVRYYLVFIMFFLIFRKEFNKEIEENLTIIFMLVSTIITFGIAKQIWFL